MQKILIFVLTSLIFITQPINAKDEVKKLLERNHCWKPLWHDIDLPMIENQDNNLPFKADTKMIGVNEPKE